VIIARSLRDRSPTAAETLVWPYDILRVWTSQCEKVCYRAMERAESRRLLECGVSLRNGWLTTEGIVMAHHHATRGALLEGRTAQRRIVLLSFLIAEAVASDILGATAVFLLGVLAELNEQDLQEAVLRARQDGDIGPDGCTASGLEYLKNEVW
jgi:hypothetical protein